MALDLSTLSLSAARQQLLQRDISALELTEACLRRIEQINPTINAFITLTPELAVQAAMQAGVLIANQPSNIDNLTLLGIPLAVKDLFDMAGVRTAAGSKFFTETISNEDAETVLKLKLAGSVLLGKTNTHEIALGVTGVNPHFGAVRNPWDITRISGGSSSGSAAAVAAGMCLGALGTDTGGSIRIPAALCGVVGLKPTYGRVSTRGVIPLSWNLDHVGPLTRTVRDATLMLSVLAGFDLHDPASVDVPVDDYVAYLEDGVQGWRVAQAVGEYIGASDPEVLSVVDEAVAIFRQLGAKIEEVDMDWLTDLAQANNLMTQADAATVHRQRLAEHPDWFGEDVRQRLMIGAAFTSTDYILARKMQVEGRRRFETFFQKHDLLLLPTVPLAAPPIEGTGALEAARQLTRFTSPFNLAGLPALSLPCGFTKTGLPIGLQVVARHWEESRALQAGCAYEQATEWHDRHPALLPLPFSGEHPGGCASRE